MRLDILPIGQFEENSYVLHDNGHVLFIDPGRYYKKIMECVGKDEVVDGIVNNPPKILHDEYIIFINQFQVLYDFKR